MLKHRLITGPLLSLALLTLIYFDNRIGSITCDCGVIFQPGLLIALLAMLVAPLAAFELNAMAKSAGIRCSIPILILSMEAWIATVYLVPSSIATASAIAFMATVLVGSFALSVICLSKGKELRGVISGSTFTVATAAYVAMGFGLLLLIRRDHSAWWILGIIAIVKMCDTGAFFVGCNFGKHKLIPWVSPAKTWEGLFGGVVTASLTAMGLATLSKTYLQSEPQIMLGYAAFLGILFGALGQLGDLIMSVFKRDSGIKDASSVLPGLGGFLDVLDSLLIVSAVAYWLLPK
ncbi:MAG: phosphatidate cytidylyltransferase [Planctomycetes bacterium]|nr:phosphatidate cytidylyltransferase [Planctomycetota bacterium]